MAIRVTQSIIIYKLEKKNLDKLLGFLKTLIVYCLKLLINTANLIFIM